MSDLSIGLAGLERAQASVNTIANRIARPPTTGQAPSDTVDLSAQAVALLQARNSFAANLNAIKTIDRLQKSVIDLLG